MGFPSSHIIKLMFRTFFVTFIATLITAAIAAVFLFRDNEPQILDNDNRTSLGVIPKIIPLSELKGGQTFLGTVLGENLNSSGSDPDELNNYLEAADKYLKEALLLTDDKQRFILIEKINNFEDAYTSAINPSGPLLRPFGASKGQADPDSLGIVMRATARYIAELSPFYYKIHPDASAVLGPVIKKLEQKRVSLLNEIASKKPELAGQLATEDIEYYIEDIRRSAARRNSDFITFSLLDYQKYRETFDELASAREEFLFGFAKNAHILFDDFYRMHEEVDRDYLDKTRKKVEDARLELRDLHKQELLELWSMDEAAARTALDETVSVIENELTLHNDWREELHDIMKNDYEFYMSLKDTDIH